MATRRTIPGNAKGEPRRRTSGGILCWLVLGLFCTLGATPPANGAELKEGQKLYWAGKYDECAKMAGETLTESPWNLEWWRLKIEAEMVRGKYDEALKTMKGALDRYPSRISMQVLAGEVYRKSGREAEAAATLEALEKAVLRDPPRGLAPEERIALGRFLLLRGVDARKVLEQFYTPTTKEHKDFIDGYFATAELALQKHDQALAAQTLYRAPKEAAENPRYHYLLARSFAGGDRAETIKALTEALRLNPRHIESLLLRADLLIDAEDYDEAKKLLDQVREVDPLEPRAWAYQAVLDHLGGDFKAEEAARQKALSRWKSNPEVDYLIGRKLSQDYRFAEGAAAQRKALAFDKNYLPAKIQLSQDLLRLGQEKEGWKLATDIFAEDGYNVVAYNLMALRDNLSHFRILKGEGFLVRMDAREAELYGARAVEILERARKTLCKKYGVDLDFDVIVEIFPRKQDFAVRTFGLPGADGFLGVCFGRVITAISPAPQGEDPSNWEAVLWHEFCHTVTLTKSRNRMPRWLSEGISVYEEMQESSAWGQYLSPQYREMILGEDLVPISELSSSFLSPKSRVHLQFAYFESAMAVDFLIQRYGLDALKGVLDDLGAGLPINEALVRRTTALKQLDTQFAEFARKRANSVAPEATWEKPELADDADSAALAAWLKEHPKSFWGLQSLGTQLALEEKWDEAEKVLKEMLALYPGYVGPGNAYETLAAVYRATSKPAKETEILEKLAVLHGDASRVYVRLIELCEAAEDWEGLARNARRERAVNPLVPVGHRALAKAAEKLGEREEALASYHALLALGDPDLAHIHYRRALLFQQGKENEKARREVLQALEEAPRFLEAHRLLLELVESSPKKEEAKPPEPGTSEKQP